MIAVPGLFFGTDWLGWSSYSELKTLGSDVFAPESRRVLACSGAISWRGAIGVADPKHLYFGDRVQFWGSQVRTVWLTRGLLRFGLGCT